jgi:hypothetical protein
MAQEKIFADGFILKRRDNAPDFVLGSLSVKLEEALPFLNSNQKNGWVNLNLMVSNTGKYYVELDTFVPKKREGDAPQSAPAKPAAVDTENLPF